MLIHPERKALSHYANALGYKVMVHDSKTPPPSSLSLTTPKFPVFSKWLRLHQAGGPFGRVIVKGLNGLRNRSIEGGGPNPTGRLGFTDVKVVA